MAGCGYTFYVSYRRRIVDAELLGLLEATGAVLIEGPKACGKTETARQQAASEVLLDVDVRAQAAIAVDPSLLLEGPMPRLMDEWQLAPAIWNHVRRAVDDRRAPGCFILTGSAVPADDITRHTGAGRITRLRMRPMTLFELGHANGSVRLEQLLAAEPPRAADPGLGVADVADLIAIGGWPGQQRGVERAIRANRSYLEDVRRTDIQRVDGRSRDPERVGRLLRAYARNIATTASARALAADAGDDGEPLDRGVVREYIDSLRRLMVIEDQPAWAPHLRSKSIVRGAVRRHLADPSLAAALLGATPARMLGDLNLMGFLFEALVIRDLRVYAQAHGGTVYHYRDNTGLEVDAIIELPGGEWAAFEIKLGQGYVDAAAANLTRFAERVDAEKIGPPATLGVITGTGYAFRRPDGVDVVPIGAMGP